MSDSGGVPNLAENLNFLFRYLPDPQGRPYSNNKAAEALQEAGYGGSSVYLSQLRSGARDNPSAMLIAGLANLFSVKTDYFFDPEVTRATQEEILAVTALRDRTARGIFTREAGVTREGLTRALEQMLDELRDEEKNRRDDDDPSKGPDDHGRR